MKFLVLTLLLLLDGFTVYPPEGTEAIGATPGVVPVVCGETPVLILDVVSVQVGQDVVWSTGLDDGSFTTPSFTPIPWLELDCTTGLNDEGVDPSVTVTCTEFNDSPSHTFTVTGYDRINPTPAEKAACGVSDTTTVTITDPGATC